MKPAESAAEPASVGHVERGMQRWHAGPEGPRRDRLAEEVPLALRYNERPFAVMLVTPCDLQDFVLGFSLSEGLIESPAQLHGVELQSQLEGIEVRVQVATDAPAARLGEADARRLPGRSGCGLCGALTLEHAVRQPRPVPAGGDFPAAALRCALGKLDAHQPINAASGAVHAAAWVDAEGDIALLREDVGRHNALDKLIGALRRDGRALQDGLLLITSRASYEIVAKAATAGIGVLAALSAPTALAVDMAQRAGVCLIGFARVDGFNVYTHGERLRQTD